MYCYILSFLVHAGIWDIGPCLSNSWWECAYTNWHFSDRNSIIHSMPPSTPTLNNSPAGACTCLIAPWLKSYSHLMPISTSTYCLFLILLTSHSLVLGIRLMHQIYISKPSPFFWSFFWVCYVHSLRYLTCSSTVCLLEGWYM
jgi:hypothetical protein